MDSSDPKFDTIVACMDKARLQGWGNYSTNRMMVSSTQQGFLIASKVGVHSGLSIALMRDIEADKILMTMLVDPLFARAFWPGEEKFVLAGGKMGPEYKFRIQQAAIARNKFEYMRSFL